MNSLGQVPRGTPGVDESDVDAPLPRPEQRYLFTHVSGEVFASLRVRVPLVRAPVGFPDVSADGEG